jgi:hypothetical protein
MHWFSPFFYMEAKFEPLEKKRLTSIGVKLFRRTARYTKEMKKFFGRVESRTS